MVDKIQMNVNETLELEYLVEQISDGPIKVNEPTSGSSSINYISKNVGVFNPSETGIHKLTINGQTVEIDVTDIPDSVDYQYPFDRFSTSTWEDTVSNADMTVNGLSSSTFADGSNAVSGYGSDSGTANGPESIAELEKWGIALTAQISNISDADHHFGSIDGNANIRLYYVDFFAPLGQPVVQLRDDNNNRLTVSSDTAIDDGTKKTVVINKTSNNATDIDIYIDDMTSAVSKTVHENESYNNTNVSLDTDMGFFCQNVDGSISAQSQSKSSIFEFNTDPYSETERVAFSDRV